MNRKETTCLYLVILMVCSILKMKKIIFENSCIEGELYKYILTILTYIPIYCEHCSITNEKNIVCNMVDKYSEIAFKDLTNICL